MASGSKPIDDADATYARAAAAEHAGNFDSAFASYLSAAQAYLHRARTLPLQRASERAKCKADAATCLARAERIKAARKGLLKPLPRDPFSKEEQTYVLDKSSRVNGVLFPVWSDVDESTLRKDSEASLLPPLGGGLLCISPVWRRPEEVYDKEQLSIGSPSVRPQDIRQNIVTDCSVCSAIAICLHHHRTFNSKLGLSCLFPRNSKGLPSISPEGLYAFRLYFNGAPRKITIDDRLPFTADGLPLSVTTTSEDGKVDTWPALLEKAYLKVLGGYDFPGSNSSVDVHTLTGWIPEHIEINSATFEREKAFSRVYEGFNRGMCVLTLGTGTRANDATTSLTTLDGSQIKLLPTHSYAVLGIHHEGDERWMTVLNPWTAGLSMNETTELVDPLDGMSMNDVERSAESDTVVSQDESYDQCKDRVESGGLIDVSWDDACDVFDALYLNWDPSLFKHSIDFHGSWRTKTTEDSPQCVHYYLYLDVSSGSSGTKVEKEQGAELWILLSRHIVDKHRTGEFIALHAVQVDREESADAVETDLDLKGIYTSNTHVMTRLTATGRTSRVALVASYEGPYVDVCFSVQAYSANSDLAWVVQPRTTAYERSVEGTFSSRNSGGNSTYPSFMNNPQYRLRLHPDTTETRQSQSSVNGKMRRYPMRLVVEGPRNVPLNVMLVWRSEDESRERVFQLRPGDAIASSGSYSYGVAQAAASIAPGIYCVIVSTFEPRHRGSFSLRVESAMRMDLEVIPVEGAGMFCKTFRGAWQPGMDGGSPRFGSYDRNPMFEIDVRTPTTLRLRLQLTKPSVAVALNVTLFASSSQHSALSIAASDSHSLYSSRPLHFALGHQVATSGAYVDGSTSPAGVVTHTTVSPGKYVAVVSTFDPGIHASFQVLVFSKADLKVSPILR